MKLWMQDTRTFVLNGNGLRIIENHAAVQVSPVGLAHGFVRGKLSVSPDGGYAAFGSDEGDVSLWDAARGSFFKLARTENLLWLSPRKVLVAMPNRGLGIFNFNPQHRESDCLREDRMIDVQTARPVKWPSPGQKGSVWRQLPVPRLDRGRVWELSIGPFGAAAVNQTTGLVVLLSIDPAEPLAVLRVPAEYPETVIYATALRNAFCVTHTGGRSIGGTNLFDYEGRWIAGVAANGLPSPVGILNSDVLVQLVEEGQFNSRLTLRTLSSKTLEVLKIAPTELDALNGYPTLHVGNLQMAMGDGRSYQVIELESLETLGSKS
jgi:hypothetical protein